MTEAASWYLQDQMSEELLEQARGLSGEWAVFEVPGNLALVWASHSPDNEFLMRLLSPEAIRSPHRGCDSLEAIIEKLVPGRYAIAYYDSTDPHTRKIV